MRCLPSSLFCFFNLIGLSLKKMETIEAPQNRSYFFNIEVFPLAILYRWKDDNVCQSIWDKREMLLGTLCFDRPPPHPPPPLPLPSITHKKKKGGPLRSMTSHWLHGNFIPKFGCHYFWPRLIALPKNTLPIVFTRWTASQL
jgi:hypothetical protein